IKRLKLIVVLGIWQEEIKSYTYASKLAQEDRVLLHQYDFIFDIAYTFVSQFTFTTALLIMGVKVFRGTAEFSAFVNLLYRWKKMVEAADVGVSIVRNFEDNRAGIKNVTALLNEVSSIKSGTREITGFKCIEAVNVSFHYDRSEPSADN